jgi:hypothetical protein
VLAIDCFHAATTVIAGAKELKGLPMDAFKKGQRTTISKLLPARDVEAQPASQTANRTS